MCMGTVCHEWCNHYGIFALALVCAGVEMVYDRGLMSTDGHVVTMPLYRNIEAIGYDLYLCEVSNSDKVIVNGKGEIVK